MKALKSRVSHHRIKAWPQYLKAVQDNPAILFLRHDVRALETDTVVVLDGHCPHAGYTGALLCFAVADGSVQPFELPY